MRILIVFSLIMSGLLACNQNAHQIAKHNFTIQRLIVLNDNNEMLMCSEQSVWASPSLAYNKPQFVKEGLDSLSNAYGIRIADLELHGQFSYKYD